MIRSFIVLDKSFLPKCFSLLFIHQSVSDKPRMYVSYLGLVADSGIRRREEGDGGNIHFLYIFENFINFCSFLLRCFVELTLRVCELDQFPADLYQTREKKKRLLELTFLDSCLPSSLPMILLSTSFLISF